MQEDIGGIQKQFQSEKAAFQQEYDKIKAETTASKLHYSDQKQKWHIEKSELSKQIIEFQRYKLLCIQRLNEI